MQVPKNCLQRSFSKGIQYAAIVCSRKQHHKFACWKRGHSAVGPIVFGAGVGWRLTAWSSIIREIKGDVWVRPGALAVRNAAAGHDALVGKRALILVRGGTQNGEML
jgi:hypothetical protein